MCIKKGFIMFKTLVGTGLMGLNGLAFAAVPAGVTTAITESVTDIGTIGAAILIVVVAVAGFAWLRKPIH